MLTVGAVTFGTLTVGAVTFGIGTFTLGGAGILIGPALALSGPANTAETIVTTPTAQKADRNLTALLKNIGLPMERSSVPSETVAHKKEGEPVRYFTQLRV
jgi:hypothetical protein